MGVRGLCGEFRCVGPDAQRRLREAQRPRLAVALAADRVIAGVGGTVMYLKTGNFTGALFYAGAAVLCAGLAILLFFGCRALTKGLLWLTKKMLLGIKTMLVGKERANA